MQLGLVTLALQGDACDSRIGLMDILENVSNMRKMEEEQAKSSDERSAIANSSLTEKQLQVYESGLSKTLTPEKVQNAMELLRSIPYRNTNEDKKLTGVSEIRDQ